MKYRRYTAPEVVEQTREAIHLFIRKQIDPFVALLDENFVWIGDYVWNSGLSGKCKNRDAGASR